MFTNLAYLGRAHEDIATQKLPVLVTAAGYYRVHTSEMIDTERPRGRKDYQLLYIAAGKAHFVFDGKERIVSKGNMILFRPGEAQFYYLYAAERPETYWVHFTGSEIETLLDHYEMPHGENIFFTGTSLDYQWIYQQMIRELQLRRPNYEELLILNLRHLFLMINRYLSENSRLGSATLDEIERATSHFNQHYNKPISIEQYAAERHMSACWFIRSFKQINQVPPMQYIVSLRITNAMNLMDNTDYSVAQVAAAVGYDNALYFSRLFRKHTGLSPTEYRKQHQA